MKRPEHRPWRVLSSEYVARRPWFTVRRESVELPTGAVVPEWYVFEFPDWVNVIARTREGLFVMISQYRHALGETRYELVAGTCEQARRLWRARSASFWRRRATAAAAGGSIWSPRPTPRTIRITSIRSLPRVSSALPKQHTEAGEDIRVYLMTEAEVRELLDGDEIMQCLHAAPLWRWMAEYGRREEHKGTIE